MGALPRPEPAPILADVDEIDGRQVLRLPQTVHINAKTLRIVPNQQGWQLEPVSGRTWSDEDWAGWLAKMRAYEQEFGDLIPGGRNQGILEPKDIFPEDSFPGSDS